jgi:hypothetical protein
MRYSFSFWLYMFKALWRHHISKRWFVWRDAPKEVVREASALVSVAKKQKDIPSSLLFVLLDARKELKLRKRRGDA